MTGWGDNGVQIMDVTNPGSRPRSQAYFMNRNGFDAGLGGLEDITIIDVRSRTFALVASWDAEGVQITRPYKPARAGGNFECL